MTLRHVLAMMLASATLGACSPALDWRELHPEGSGIEAQFPCKPDRHARTVPLAGLRPRMEMLVCSGAETSFALSFVDVDVDDPAAVGRVLDALRALAVSNIGAGEPAAQPAQVVGMTPNPAAVRLSLAGHLPDGTAVRQHTVLFSKGLRVYQASVVGAQPPQEAVETFFAALRLPS